MLQAQISLLQDVHTIETADGAAHVQHALSADNLAQSSIKPGLSAVLSKASMHESSVAMQHMVVHAQPQIPAASEDESTLSLSSEVLVPGSTEEADVPAIETIAKQCNTAVAAEVQPTVASPEPDAVVTETQKPSAAALGSPRLLRTAAERLQAQQLLDNSSELRPAAAKAPAYSSAPASIQEKAVKGAGIGRRMSDGSLPPGSVFVARAPASQGSAGRKSEQSAPVDTSHKPDSQKQLVDPQNQGVDDVNAKDGSRQVCRLSQFYVFDLCRSSCCSAAQNNTGHCRASYSTYEASVLEHFSRLHQEEGCLTS